jgi:hypothetical protein
VARRRIRRPEHFCQASALWRPVPLLGGPDSAATPAYFPRTRNEPHPTLCAKTIVSAAQWPFDNYLRRQRSAPPEMITSVTFLQTRLGGQAQIELPTFGTPGGRLEFHVFAVLALLIANSSATGLASYGALTCSPRLLPLREAPKDRERSVYRVLRCLAACQPVSPGGPHRPWRGHMPCKAKAPLLTGKGLGLQKLISA